MTIWKFLAIIGGLAAFILFAVSLASNLIFLIGAAVGAANFAMLALIVDRLPPPKD